MKTYFVFTLLLATFFLNELNSKEIYFKPTSYYNESINSLYNLQIDSIKIYNYNSSKDFTLIKPTSYNFDNDVFVDELTNQNTINVKNIILQNSTLNLLLDSKIEGNVKINLYNINGLQLVEQKANAKIGNNSFAIKINPLENSEYFLNIESSNIKLSIPFIKIENDIVLKKTTEVNYPLSKLSNKDKYRLTAYSKNRAPITLDNIIPNENDTLKFKFGFSYPYYFINAKSIINFPECEINQSLKYTDGKTITDTLKKFIDTSYYNLNTDNMLEIQNDTNYYSFKFGIFTDESSSKQGSKVILTMKNGEYASLIFSSSKCICETIYELGWPNYSFVIQNPKFTIVGNQMIFELNENDINDLLRMFQYSGEINSAYFEYKRTLKMISYKSTNAKVYIVLDLF